MSEAEPKLTPTFKDMGTVVPPGSPTVFPYPASRTVSVQPLSPFGHILGPPPSQSPLVPPPEQKPQRTKVAIIGTAPSSRMLAPFNDPDCEIWSCSPGNMDTFPRVDVWFEIHGNLHWPEHASYGVPYLTWLAKQTFPVYMQDQRYFPHALTFPVQELIDEFGGDFFSSSFAWMMAFAIKRGFKEIGLYGVDMASRDEYILQRPGFYFFKREAERRGIKVLAPNESDIMQAPGLYGYSEVTPFGRKLHAREFELKQRIAHLEQSERPKAVAALKQIDDNILYMKGAVEDNDYMKSIHIRIGTS